MRLLACICLSIVAICNSLAGEQLDSARFYFNQGDFDRSKECYWNAVLETRSEHGEKSDEYVAILPELARLFEVRGNVISAQRIYEKRLELARVVHGKECLQYAESLQGIGRIQTFKCDFESARGYFERSENLLVAQKGDTSLANCVNLMYKGDLEFITGKYTRAEIEYRKAFIGIEAHLEEEDPFMLQILNRLALLNFELRNYGEASETFQKILKRQRSLYGSEHPFYANTLRNFASVYLEVDHHENAAKLLDHALSILEKSVGTRHFDYTLTLSKRAKAYQLEGQFEMADSLYTITRSTLETTVGTQHYLYARLLGDIADLRYRTGDYEDARSLLEEAIEIRKVLFDFRHPDYIANVDALSRIYWAQGKMGMARQLYSSAAQSYLEQFELQYLFLSEQEKSLFYEGIRDFFEKYNEFIYQQCAQKPSLLGDMYDYRLATKAVLFHSTKKLRESIAKSDNDTIKSNYEYWINAKEQLAKIYKLGKREIEKQDIPLDQLQLKANTLEKMISLYAAEDKKQNKDKLLQMGWKDIAKSLNEDEAAIEIIRFREFLPDSGGSFTEGVRYAALIITANTKGSPELVMFEDGAKLETRHAKLFKNLIFYKIKDEKSYNTFWKPIADSPALSGKKKLYVSLDGIYYSLSLSTLYVPDSDEYLMDKYDLHLVNNTKDVLGYKADAADHKDVHEGAVVLMGYPNYHLDVLKHDTTFVHDAHADGEIHTRGGIRSLLDVGHELTELPGTKDEVESIRHIIRSHDDSVEIVMGNEAIEDYLKELKSPKVIHIATHGFFIPEDHKNGELIKDLDEEGLGEIEVIQPEHHPLLNSGLMLAAASHAYERGVLLRQIQAFFRGEDFEDGILTSYEAMNLHLFDTELVVNSACETGLGEIKNGEGVYGLQRAFQTAGAKSLIMSLWKVDDDATNLLMTNFYNQWWLTNDKRLAFRNAQLILRKKYPHPYFWGAFVMVGE